MVRRVESGGLVSHSTQSYKGIRTVPRGWGGESTPWSSARTSRLFANNDTRKEKRLSGLIDVDRQTGGVYVE